MFSTLPTQQDAMNREALLLKLRSLLSAADMPAAAPTAMTMSSAMQWSSLRQHNALTSQHIPAATTLDSSFPLASRAALLASLANGGGVVGSALPIPGMTSSTSGHQSAYNRLLELRLKASLAAGPTIQPMLQTSVVSAAAFQAPTSTAMDALVAAARVSPRASNAPSISSGDSDSGDDAPVHQSLSRRNSKPAAPRFSIAESIRKRTRISSLKTSTTVAAPSAPAKSISRPVKKRRVTVNEVNSHACFPLPSAASVEACTIKFASSLTFQAKWDSIAAKKISKASKTTAAAITKKQEQAFAKELFCRSLGKTL